MRKEQQEKHALECAQHIIKISRVHADEYRDSWFGGESNLAKDYMRLRNEVKSLRESLASAAAGREVTEAMVEAAAEALYDLHEDWEVNRFGKPSSASKAWVHADGETRSVRYQQARAALTAALATEPQPKAGREVTDSKLLTLVATALPDFKWAAWLLLHAAKQGVNEHRSMMDSQSVITQHIERIESALTALAAERGGEG